MGPLVIVIFTGLYMGQISEEYFTKETISELFKYFGKRSYFFTKDEIIHYIFVMSRDKKLEKIIN